MIFEVIFKDISRRTDFWDWAGSQKKKTSGIISREIFGLNLETKVRWNLKQFLKKILN